jgi:uncharacterized damage-inducible protein DinB
MIEPSHCRVMAVYNAEMNERLYEVAASMPDGDRRADLGAFFDSIFATFNHLLWADQVWMSRFTSRARPGVGIRERMYDDFDALRRARQAMDEEIRTWADGVSRDWLAATVSWRSGQDGTTRSRPAWLLAVHLFNHQTHHRGQITAMMSRLGYDYGVTDVPWMPGVEEMVT